MKTRHLFLLLAILFLCAPAFSQGVPSPATPRLMIGADGTLVSTTNPLPVDAKVNIGSETIGLVSAIASVEAAIEPVSGIATQTITITGAAASAQITSGVTTRRYISISSQNVNQNVAVWINFGGAASTGVGELVYTGVSYPFDENVDVWLYSDTTVDVYVIEGGTL